MVDIQIPCKFGAEILQPKKVMVKRVFVRILLHATVCVYNFFERPGTESKKCLVSNTLND